MRYTQQEADALFAQMLIPEEISKCPIYCMFPSTGFFASPSKFNVGYVTCTSHGRILMAVQTFAGWSTGSLNLRTVKQIKIKKNIVGQYVVEARFPTDKKDFIFKIQAASKVYGVNMPNQTEHLDSFISMLRVYE